MDNMLRTLGSTYIKLNPVEGFTFSKLKLVTQETIDAFKDGTLEAEKDTLYYSNTIKLPPELLPENPEVTLNKYLGFNENGEREWKEVEIDSKVSKDQGIENTGKLLVVGQNGFVSLDDSLLIELADLNAKVTSISALGGYITAHDFGSATPDQTTFTNYALTQITSITDPLKIWNGTKVKNTFNGETWVLVNTQNTIPVIFEWVNIGIDFVGKATNDTLGLVKGSDVDLKVNVGSDGEMEVNRLAQKLETIFPVKPDIETNKFLGWDGDGNRIWKPLVVGTSGFRGNIYLTSRDSDIPGYKEMNYLIEPSETERTFIVNNEEILTEAFLAPVAIGTDIIDSGIWSTELYVKLSSAANVSWFRTEGFLYHEDGSETLLYSSTSHDIGITEYDYVKNNYITGSISCLPTDRLGFKLYVGTARTNNTTISYIIGDGFGSFFNTPLALRHSQLREPNEDPNYLHLTQEEKNKVLNASKIESTYEKEIYTWHDNYVSGYGEWTFADIQTEINLGRVFLEIYQTENNTIAYQNQVTDISQLQNSWMFAVSNGDRDADVYQSTSVSFETSIVTYSQKLHRYYQEEAPQIINNKVNTEDGVDISSSNESLAQTSNIKVTPENIIIETSNIILNGSMDIYGYQGQFYSVVPKWAMDNAISNAAVIGDDITTSKSGNMITAIGLKNFITVREDV